MNKELRRNIMWDKIPHGELISMYKKTFSINDDNAKILEAWIESNPISCICFIKNSFIKTYSKNAMLSMGYFRDYIEISPYVSFYYLSDKTEIALYEPNDLNTYWEEFTDIYGEMYDVEIEVSKDDSTIAHVTIYQRDDDMIIDTLDTKILN